jgi:hypothetical protein
LPLPPRPTRTLRKPPVPGDQIAARRVIGNQVDHCVSLVGGEQFIGPPLVGGEFDHRYRATKHGQRVPQWGINVNFGLKQARSVIQSL